MRNIAAALLTSWYALLTMLFCFGVAVSLMSVVWGLSEPSDNALGAGAFGLFSFGWGVRRYLALFVARVEQVQKNSDRFKDWDDEDN